MKKHFLRRLVPIIPTYIFLGLAFGALMQSKGYPIYYTLLSSIFIYAGSMQVIMLSILGADLSYFSIALLAFLVNARHMFYGLGMLSRFKKKGIALIYYGFALTDETYCILSDSDDESDDFKILITAHLIWIITTLIGSIFGSIITFNTTGIEFSVIAFFTVVIVNQIQSSKRLSPGVIGVLSALVCWIFFGSEYFILPALLMSTLILYFLSLKKERK